jgi:hypothetical protein
VEAVLYFRERHFHLLRIHATWGRRSRDVRLPCCHKGLGSPLSVGETKFELSAATCNLHRAFQPLCVFGSLMSTRTAELIRRARSRFRSRCRVSDSEEAPSFSFGTSGWAKTLAREKRASLVCCRFLGPRSGRAHARKTSCNLLRLASGNVFQLVRTLPSCFSIFYLPQFKLLAQTSLKSHCHQVIRGPSRAIRAIWLFLCCLCVELFARSIDV